MQKEEFNVTPQKYIKLCFYWAGLGWAGLGWAGLGVGVAPLFGRGVRPSMTILNAVRCSLFRKYNVILRQQPKHSRMCGFGDKVDRRPVDPPPIIVKEEFWCSLGRWRLSSFGTSGRVREPTLYVTFFNLLPTTSLFSPFIMFSLFITSATGNYRLKRGRRHVKEREVYCKFSSLPTSPMSPTPTPPISSPNNNS